MSSDRKRVLVAEDEAMIALMVEDFLDMLGYDVAGICSNVADGIRLVQEGAAIDLAILDCHLGDGPVWPLARELSEARIPFMFASGDNGHGVPDDLSSHPTLGKPFSSDALGRALRDLRQD